MMKFFYKKKGMNKFLKRIIFLLLFVNFLTGCQSLKDGFSNNKKSKSAEEFLIEKKNPLVLPPDFSKLPVPKNETDKANSEKYFDIKKILKNNTSNNKKINKVETDGSLEKSIIEKIKKN